MEEKKNPKNKSGGGEGGWGCKLAGRWCAAWHSEVLLAKKFSRWTNLPLKNSTSMEVQHFEHFVGVCQACQVIWQDEVEVLSANLWCHPCRKGIQSRAENKELPIPPYLQAHRQGCNTSSIIPGYLPGGFQGSGTAKSGICSLSGILDQILNGLFVLLPSQSTC